MAASRQHSRSFLTYRKHSQTHLIHASLTESCHATLTSSKSVPHWRNSISRKSPWGDLMKFFKQIGWNFHKAYKGVTKRKTKYSLSRKCHWNWEIWYRNLCEYRTELHGKEETKELQVPSTRLYQAYPNSVKFLLAQHLSHVWTAQRIISSCPLGNNNIHTDWIHAKTKGQYTKEEVWTL